MNRFLPSSNILLEYDHGEEIIKMFLKHENHIC